MSLHWARWSLWREAVDFIRTGCVIIGLFGHVSRHINFSSDPEQSAFAAISGLGESVCASKLVFFPPVPGAQKSCPPFLECNFHSRCLMFFGCRSGLCFCRGTGRVGCPCWREDGAPGEVWGGGKAQTRLGLGSLPPRCLQPNPEVRICPGGEGCTKHVGLLPHRNFFSVLNKICLSLELKVFYLEGKSSLKGPGRFSWKTWLTWIQSCLCSLLASVVFCLYLTPTNSWGFSLIWHPIPLAPMSPLIFFCLFSPKRLSFGPAFFPTGASLSILLRLHENKVLWLLLVS